MSKMSDHTAWFLGPKAEHHESWEKMLVYIFRDYVYWRRNYFPDDNVVINSRLVREQELMTDTLNDELDKILASFKSQNPIYSPRYIAHMVSEQTLPSVVGYFAGLLYNANNISGESSPAGFPLELEVGKIVAKMLGYEAENSWTHITSGGTVANIEAMWTARTVKYIPLQIQEYCQSEKMDFRIMTPNGTVKDIRECDYYTLLHLEPSDAICMVRRLISHVIEKYGEEPAVVSARIKAFQKESDFNVIERGLYSILRKTGIEPVLFLSPSAHYSLNKAVNVLGYGHDSLQVVDVDNNFRMDSALLKERLYNCPKDKYIAAVVGIAGTTEEGAVDPLHKIEEIRRMLNKEENRSFWFHIDSAWGGYIRSLFNGYDISGNMEEKVDKCRRIINQPLEGENVKDLIWENDDNNYRAYLAFPFSDSVTIDPHKLGYIPYPAGMVSFKNGIVTELIRQDAPYVFDNQNDVKSDLSFHVEDIGSYTLEGSKPGAAAASCYLAHKTIPLELSGHGQIIKSTLISTQKLQRLMREHLAFFDYYAGKAAANNKGQKEHLHYFTFMPIHHSDTNLICYIMVPMEKTEMGYCVDRHYGLKELNQLNQKLYETMSVGNNNTHNWKLQDFDFFVSKTRFLDSIYKYDSISRMLESIGIDKESYREEGLFVLRSTVMNPFYELATSRNKDYLEEFIVNMHGKAADILDRFEYR
ncbi:MAG TPA: hypothetical protein IAA79_04695 [Candidatus Avirikenella pullistercoris]|nr:hypothetical protein [Candidatus Avirikenella pullistercoris]